MKNSLMREFYDKMGENQYSNFWMLFVATGGILSSLLFGVSPVFNVSLLIFALFISAFDMLHLVIRRLVFYIQSKTKKSAKQKSEEEGAAES